MTVIGTSVSVALTIASVTSPIGLAIDIGITLLAPALADAYQFLFHRVHHYHFDSPPFAISSTPLNNLFDINGASVSYGQVTVKNGDGGKIVNSYTSQIDYPDSTSNAELNCLAKPVKAIYGNVGSYAPSTSFNFERGLLLMSRVYDNTGTLISSTHNTYQLSRRVAAVPGQRSSVSGYATLSDGSFQVITYNVGLYNEVAQNIQLIGNRTDLTDQADRGNILETTMNFVWQPDYPTLLHSQRGYRSDGKWLTNYMSYPMEYAPGTAFLDNMVSHKMFGVPIERISTIGDETDVAITGGTISRYKAGGLGLLDTVFALRASKPIPLSSFKFSNHLIGVINGTYQPYKMDNSYLAKAFFQSYDSKNNLVQSQTVGESPSSVIWGYHQDVPIAQISNAAINQVAYTSFETNDQRYWQFSSSGRDSSDVAKTGKVRYQLSAAAVTTTATIPVGTYILSLWTKGSKPAITGITADVPVVNGESDGHSWNFFMDRITVSGSSHVTLTGSGMTDEFRLYPYGAHMSTAAVALQVGTLSVCSQDDKVNSYEYDGLQRVKNIRNDQYNILKSFTYSNVAPVPCIDTPSRWKGINPVCYVDQNNIVPDTTHYTVAASNSYGNIVCSFTRTQAESSYLAKVNFTTTFSDNTTYSNSALLKSGDLSTLWGLPLVGKSAESIKAVSIDSVVNLSNNYGVTLQGYTNRQRLRDGYIEANTMTGGLGPYIAPVQSAVGCSTPLFTNKEQNNFFKNDCPNASGTPVTYTVAAGTYSGSTQFSADSMARAVGQAYANLHGTCSLVDTSFVGINPYCITGTADSGTPSLSDYSINIIYSTGVNMLNAKITRTTGAATHDATVTYQLQFNDGSAATYTAPIYKDQAAITISPPLAGYGPYNVSGITITSVAYSALNRQAFTNRKRLLNGVADSYTEANSAGPYYLAPLPSAGACDTWFYNTAQTGFYRNNCSAGPGFPVTYTVAAHSDSSKVSQAFADALARIRGQSYANLHGACFTADTLVTTFSGNTHAGYVDGPANIAEFTNPWTTAIDNTGNLYVADGNNYSLIRKISPDGTVSTLAGSPTPGFADGMGTAARFSYIYGLSTDASGNIYVADGHNFKIRKVTPAGVVTTLAGSTSGFADGTGAAAKFNLPYDLKSDLAGNCYVSDIYNYRIRMVTPSGVVSTFAGNGTSGYVDGPVSSAEFESAGPITLAPGGILYVADNGRIRKISGGMVSFLAGDGTFGGFQDGTGASAKFGSVSRMTTDASGNIYLTDDINSCVRKVTPAGVVTTITTHGAGGYADGPISTARFNLTQGVAVGASGNLYISEYGNLVIRKITFPH